MGDELLSPQQAEMLFVSKKELFRLVGVDIIVRNRSSKAEAQIVSFSTFRRKIPATSLSTNRFTPFPRNE